MKQSSPPPVRPSRWRHGAHSTASLCVAVILSLTLGGCDLRPFDDERPAGNGAQKKSTLFDRTPKACPTACALASASKHELSLLFGSKEPPAKLAWGQPYVDGAGFKQFSRCVGENAEDPERLKKCLVEAHSACIEACVESESARINRKSGLHHGRDAARKKARKKRQVERAPRSP